MNTAGTEARAESHGDNLLQEMVEYDGIVILATNLRKNLDEAFARRTHFSVEFPQPEEHRIDGAGLVCGLFALRVLCG